MYEPGTSSIKTYRYLRLAMVAMIGLLAVSLAIEWWETGRSCLQTSISAYYYTPVAAIFVGTLITIGICMVALKGNTEREDVLLNVAGMLAPVVALVPTPGKGTCHSAPVTLSDTAANVGNNMLAVIIVAALCLLITGYILFRTTRELKYVAGFTIAGLIIAGAVAWFFLNRDGFITGAHYTAAVAMFVCIVGVVLLNAYQFGRKTSNQTGSKPPAPNRYFTIAVAMVAGPLLMWLADLVWGWDHAVLWIEGLLIALFALFWLIQTQELWNEGVREEIPAEPAAAESAAAQPDELNVT